MPHTMTPKAILQIHFVLCPNLIFTIKKNKFNVWMFVKENYLAIKINHGISFPSRRRRLLEEKSEKRF